MEIFLSEQLACPIRKNLDRLRKNFRYFYDLFYKFVLMGGFSSGNANQEEKEANKFKEHIIIFYLAFCFLRKRGTKHLCMQHCISSSWRSPLEPLWKSG